MSTWINNGMDNQEKPLEFVVVPSLCVVSISGAGLQRLARFALVSGLGLAIDVGLFLMLLAVSVRAGYANFVSAAAAVTFVYFVSSRQVFAYKGCFLIHLFVVYAIYQIAAVTAASWAVDLIVRAGVAPLISKALILPATFLANYVFMDFLTKAKPGRQLAETGAYQANKRDDDETII